MIINNFSQCHQDNTFVIEADVQFESERRFFKAQFSVPSDKSSWLAVRPDAFMLGAAMAAMWLGESRLKIEGDVDPQLVARLSLATRLITRWWAHRGKPLQIEAAGYTNASAHEPVDAKQVAIFLSGGVDSFAALLWNIKQYAHGDPRRVTVAFFVNGVDIGDPNKPARQDVFVAGHEKLAAICESLGIELVPITINLRSLCSDWRLYANWQFASLLAAIAHAAGHRIRQAIIASDNDLEYLTRHGSHPWLNSYYSSDSLSISTGDTEQFSRLQRVRMLTTEPYILRSLRVCWEMEKIPLGALNCGHCPKCVRTLLELIACGSPLNNSAFPVEHVKAEMLKSTRIDKKEILEYYRELPEPLRTAGRADLARAVEWKLWSWTVREATGLNWLRPKIRKFLNSLQFR